LREAIARLYEEHAERVNQVNLGEGEPKPLVNG